MINAPVASVDGMAPCATALPADDAAAIVTLPWDSTKEVHTRSWTAPITVRGVTAVAGAGNVDTRITSVRQPTRHGDRLATPPIHRASTPPTTTAPLGGGIDEVVCLQARKRTRAAERGGTLPPLPQSTTAAREGGIDDRAQLQDKIRTTTVRGSMIATATSVPPTSAATARPSKHKVITSIGMVNLHPRMPLAIAVTEIATAV